MAGEAPGEDSSSPNAKKTIQAVKRGARGKAVYIALADGSSFFVPEERCGVSLWSEGMLLSDEEYACLLREDEALRARWKALELISRREHSRRQLEQKLLQRRFSGETVRRVTAELVSRELIDDRRFAAMWLTSRGKRLDQGRGRLLAGLQSRGVSREAAEDALEEFCEEADFNAALEKAWEKQQRRGVTEREKVIRRLVARGFSYRQVSDFLEKKAGEGDPS